MGRRWRDSGRARGGVVACWGTGAQPCGARGCLRRVAARSSAAQLWPGVAAAWHGSGAEGCGSVVVAGGCGELGAEARSGKGREVAAPLAKKRKGAVAAE